MFDAIFLPVLFVLLHSQNAKKNAKFTYKMNAF